MEILLLIIPFAIFWIFRWLFRKMFRDGAGMETTELRRRALIFTGVISMPFILCASSLWLFAGISDDHTFYSMGDFVYKLGIPLTLIVLNFKQYAGRALTASDDAWAIPLIDALFLFQWLIWGQILAVIYLKYRRQAHNIDAQLEAKEPNDVAEKLGDSVSEVSRLGGKATRSLIIGLVVLILGLGLAAVVPLSFSYSLDNAESSVETLEVRGGSQEVIEIQTREGRYDWQIYSTGSFDGYLILDEHFSAYLAGEEFTKVGQEESVTLWTPFLQTGGASNHGIAVVNRGSEAIEVEIHSMFRTNPPFFVFFLLPIGLLVALGGFVLAAVGLTRMLRKD